MNKNILQKVLLLICIAILPLTAFGQRSMEEVAEAAEDGFNFLLITDCGRNGFYDQKPIAYSMGELAGEGDAEFVLALGDTFHYMGLQSIHDPLWRSNFEDIYNHPELQIPWYPLIGNHESQGNIQALIDYSEISRRWQMPDRYYTKKFTTDEGETLEIFVIDTCPLIDKYRNEEKYIGAKGQSREKQLAWLEKSLANSKADFKIVAGHHPVYADTSKDEEERRDMQKYVEPLLKKYGVHLYIGGHIHNHQHIIKEGSKTNYVVLSSGSLSRKVSPIEGTQFCSPRTGFGFASIKGGVMTLFLLDKDGNELYSFTINK